MRWVALLGDSPTPGGEPVSGHVRTATAVRDTERAAAEVARVLQRSTDVTLLGHVNPDADALGSALALGAALQCSERAVRVSFDPAVSPSPGLLSLDTRGLLVAAEDVPQAPSTLVVCDSGVEHRLGALADRVRATRDAGGDVVVLDHHEGNTFFGTVHAVDETAEATVLVVLRVLDALGTPLDPDLARCLYAGLVTDTRCFRAAGPDAYRVAARLLDAGVDPTSTTRCLMDAHPHEWLGMLSNVLGVAELEPTAAQGLGLVYTTVRLSDSAGLHGGDVDSVVDLLRATNEAEVTAVLKEFDGDRWMVSLRSEGELDVASVARTCGGGGHRLAAGFTARATHAEVLSWLRAALAAAPRLS